MTKNTPEIWTVSWTTYKDSFDIEHPKVKERFMAFVDENEARDFAKKLEDAKVLLELTALPAVSVRRQ